MFTQLELLHNVIQVILVTLFNITCFKLKHYTQCTFKQKYTPILGIGSQVINLIESNSIEKNACRQVGTTNCPTNSLRSRRGTIYLDHYRILTSESHTTQSQVQLCIRKPTSTFQVVVKLSLTKPRSLHVQIFRSKQGHICFATIGSIKKVNSVYNTIHCLHEHRASLRILTRLDPYLKTTY